MTGIIDAHYHLEEGLETVEALLGQMQTHNIDRVALIPKMNEPFHLKPIPKKAGEMLPKLLVGKLKALGLMLYNSTLTKDGKLSTLGIKYQLYHKPDNAYIDDVLQAHADKFYGWIFVNPKTMNPIQELERWAGRPGWIGVKTHPFWHAYPVSRLDDVAAFCREKDMPILMHLGGDRATGDFRYLPERHPGLKIMYAHAGIPYYREVWSYAREKTNVFVDLSNALYVNVAIIEAVIKTLGYKKCLYGTDGPYAESTQSRMLKRISQLTIPDIEKEHILGANFLELIAANH